MKIYISADIEGTAGITNWDEARKTHADYPEHRQQMTREVLAACDGAMAAGAKDILIKDARGRELAAAESAVVDQFRLMLERAGRAGDFARGPPAGQGAARRV